MERRRENSRETKEGDGKEINQTIGFHMYVGMSYVHVYQGSLCVIVNDA